MDHSSYLAGSEIGHQTLTTIAGAAFAVDKLHSIQCSDVSQLRSVRRMRLKPFP